MSIPVFYDCEASCIRGLPIEIGWPRQADQTWFIASDSARRQRPTFSIFTIFISGEAGAARALDYIARIENYCLGFASTPEQGTKRDDIRTGLRITGFERRFAIAFRVDDRRVTILRILYGGRNLARTASR